MLVASTLSRLQSASTAESYSLNIEYQRSALTDQPVRVHTNTKPHRDRLQTRVRSQSETGNDDDDDDDNIKHDF